MNVEFNGQVVLVTGGTRGIGKQMADDFAALGADVIVTGRGVSKEQSEDSAVRRRHLSVDFTDPSSVEGFLSEVEAIERVDVLINNAGINRVNPIDETRTEDWDAIRAVNLDAPFLLTRTVSRIMKRHQYGRIVNIASIFGVISKPKRVLYSMSKFGLRGLTAGSSLDLAPHGILVNTISPGFVMTDLTRSILSADEIEELAREVPLGRFAQPSEIAKVVLFLASRHNSYLTGQNIVVDGGFVNV
jgi:NAD(P)-dependent dehydrogenase (short-subunit alcohol dehydrogenase family)